MWRYLALTIGLSLSGCASNAPVPVSEASAPTVVEAPKAPPSGAPATPSDQYYVVKKGDTLYRIAATHHVDVPSLAAWNNIVNPADVAVGRQLRLTPPEGSAPQGEAVVVTPVTGPGQVTVIGQAAHAAGGNAELVKREPRGGTVAYSETALAQARAMEGSAAGGKGAAEPAPAEKPAEVPPAAPPAPAAATPPPASAAPAMPAETAVAWVWPTEGKVFANFDEGGGGKASNKGIDIAGRLGQPIVAAAAGKVTYVGTLHGYGDFLVIRHNADYISVYAHAGRILVKKDQSVNKGQKIGEVGTSDADRPELHFEIRRQSKPVDPLTFLPPRS